jgi:hypothetical protein
MQKHPTHVIDEQAVHIFKGSLPPEHWTVYDIRPDYGKDHKVELVEGGEHTGLSFWVQVKGQKKVKKLKDGTVSFKLETKDLDYHVKLQAPVFLVVVDVSRRVGYWVFTQKYERTRLKNLPWRQQSHIQIRLPAENLISDLYSLRGAVRDAIGYMARRSLSLGIGHAQESLKRLDPRFDVRVTATAAGEVAEVNALTDIRVEFKFGRGFFEDGRFDDLLGRGIPVSIGPGDVTAEGSLLIKSVLDETAESKGAIQICLGGVGHVRLTHTDAEDRDVGRPHEIECVLEGGLQEARFCARTSFSTLILQGTISARADTPMELKIGCNLGPWLGRMISSLPNFELVEDLLGRLELGHRMKAEFFVGAMPIFSGYMVWGQAELDFARRTMPFVELVSEARWIVREFGLNVALPCQIGEDQIHEIARLYRIARGEEIRLKGAVQTASARLTRLNMNTLAKVVGLGGEPLRLAYLSDRPQPFLGVLVDVGPVETELSHMRLAVDRQTLNRQIVDGVKPIPLTWEATPQTEFVIRKASQELLAACQVAEQERRFLE